ncbi:MAG: hypothetical protein ACRC7S_08560 [Cetobacterium sp.]
MKLWDEDKDFKPSDYDRCKKVRAMENRVDNRTAIMQEIWKLNDKVALGWKDLRMLLEVGNKDDIKVMKKGLKSVSDELDRISKDLRSYYETDDYIDFE